MSEQQKINRCQCGSPNSAIDVVQSVYHKDGMQQCVCRTCRMSGPSAYGLKDAVAAWNRIVQAVEDANEMREAMRNAVDQIEQQQIVSARLILEHWIREFDNATT